MNTEQKLQIANSVDKYIKEKDISRNVFARNAGVNPAYLSAILSGKSYTMAGEKKVEIADKYYVQLQEAIGAKSSGWRTLDTPQSIFIKSELLLAKDSGKTLTLIGGTGCGKTFTTDEYVREYPQATYRIVVSALHTLTDIIGEMLQAMGLPEQGSKANRMKRMIEHLRDVRRSGGKPQIIMDESENIKAPVFGLLKGLYDGLKLHCSIVMIGTPELYKKMDLLKRKEKYGMPQLYRRFKAGIRHIPAVDSFAIFFDAFNIQDKGLRKLLGQLCENLGELNDYLEPAMKESQRIGEELTEEFFRLMFNIPNY